MSIKHLLQVAVIFATFLILILHNLRTVANTTVEDIETIVGETETGKLERVEAEKTQYRVLISTKNKKIDSLEKVINSIRKSEIDLRENSDRKRKFALKYGLYAMESEKKHGIPHSIILGQAILESNAGESSLARLGNNFFGIKCGKKICVHKEKCISIITKEEVNGVMVEKIANFRRFKSEKEGFDYHGLFLNKSRYKSLQTIDKADYVSWAKGLKKQGYATDSRYPSKLKTVIEKYIN